MTVGDNEAPIREAVGIFFDADHLEQAIEELSAAGFDREELGLLASEYAVRQRLSHLYERTSEHPDVGNAPATAFVKKESIGDTIHGLAGSLFFVGSTTAAGAVVASAAVLGGGLLSAVTGVAAIGAIGAVMALLIHESDAEYLEEQVDEGHVLLFVRTPNATREEQAVAILSRHSGYDARIHEISAATTAD